jgi:alpha-2-macroglobulin
MRRMVCKRPFALALSLLAIFLLASCAGKAQARSPKAPDPTRVEAHSAGLIPAASAIKVVLTEAAGEAGQPVPAGVFRLYPSVPGKARWEDERTLAFLPDKPLAQGRSYRVEFDSGALGARGDARLGSVGGGDYFSFDIRSAEQRVSVDTLPPRVAQGGGISVEGRLSLVDGAKAEAVEKALSASEGRLSWSHESATLHRFTVSGIASSAKARELAISWNGAALGGGGRGKAMVKLPSSASFELVSARSLAGDSGSRGVELAFSRPLARGQDLRGLVSVEGVESLRYAMSGSTVSLYADAWPASAKVRVEKGLKDSTGAFLAQGAAASVAFDWEKPAVRFLTKGNILPTDQGLVLPIETMNLSGVIVEALRVYGDNMLQFLQVNDLDSFREMKRVGEVVWSKQIDLGWKDDWKNRWVRQGLDLSPLLAAHKDGMFQIRITFRKGDIRYVCPNGHDFKDLRFPEAKVLDRDDGEYSFWNYVEEWADGYDDYYKYKDDPCHPAFYLPSYDHDITIKRNVVVSDLGAAVKRESDGAWHVAVSDLRSAKPIAGANVTLYSYQRKALASGATGGGGIAVLRPDAAPYFATVQYGSQTSWLKVDEGSSLAVGHFDVGGEKADSGLKGFIYGERGVWRPGDAMHLVFMLYDRSGKLPAKYPISFELEDPLGRVVRAGTYTESVNGFYAIETGTAQDAPTGPYVARVKAGGLAFTKNLKVETVMPNRLKVELGWDGTGLSGGSGLPYLSPDTESMSLAASWLTGAKAGALKADVSATFSAAGTSFMTLPDYAFDDPTRTVSGDRAVLFDDRLDPDGTASFDIDLSPGSSLPPGKLRANLLTRVFEPSGIFSSESSSVDFHPYARYVGLRLPKGDASRGMLLTDRDQRVDLALVDRDGKLLKSGAKVEVALYQLEWRWWWEKGEESLAERASELFQRPIKKDTVTIGPDGRGSWIFQVKYPNWGRYLVRAVDVSSPAGAEGGHASGKVLYVDWPGWAGKGRDSGGAQAMLELTVGSPKYAPGQTASVSFPSNAEGRALVQIERAGRILREEWVQTKKDTSSYEFAVTPDMAPNVYVHVTFVQPHLQTANDLPIRLYGVAPVMVEDPATRLKPLIETADTLSPGSLASFSVREEKGRPMTYTVAVVDEGLLGITRYQAPDPWNEFYKKEASALSAWDLYQYVAGAYSGQLETLLAIGGSDDALGGGNRKPSRFPAVVYAFPPRTLKAGETARESFRLGTYIGALRFMVIAGAMPATSGGGVAGSGAAFGAAERSVSVRAELMGQLTAPRVLSPGEEASIPATVFAFMGAKKVSVSLAAEGSLSLVGDGAKSLDFKQDGDLSAMFRVKAAAVPGPGKLRLAATAGGKSAEQSIDIEVRAVGAPVSSVTVADLGAGKSWSGELELPGEPGTNGLSVEISRLKPIDLADRLDWLIRYPHGCAEQTASAAFPQLYLPKVASLGEDQAKAARDNVAAGIAKLRGFQTTRGGFSMWPGNGGEDEWISAYVAHFLLAARKEGFEVPQGLLDPALDYLSRAARGWNSTEPWSQSAQAYRLYDLALAGAPEVAAMNRFRDYPGIPAAARFRLAAAYAMSGMRDAATALTRGLSVEVSEYEGMGDYTYGTATRERGIVLDALNALGDSARAMTVYNKLADELGSHRWYSTQDLGVALGAALPYAMMAASSEPQSVRVSLAAEAGSPGAAPWSLEARLDKPMARVELPAPGGTSASLTLSNAGKAPVFARIVARGVPAAGKERPLANGLSLSLRYLGMDGKVLDPARAAPGTDFSVEATVRNLSGQALKNLALTQLLPSGWEIANYRVGSELPKPKAEEDGERIEAKAPEAPLYDYQDLRDDRVITYFSLGTKDPKVFTTYVTKAYEGSFFLPAASVQAMYDEERYQALVPGRWLDPSAPKGGDSKSGSGKRGSSKPPSSN